MRVISQCGRGDFPYEQISLVIRNFGQTDQWLIVAHGLYFKDDLGTRIAEYSTEGKARKVMEILQKEYLCYMTNNLGTAFNQPKVFKFPKDEEIGVVD